MKPSSKSVFDSKMPPKTTKTAKKITIAPDQGSIHAFFHKPAAQTQQTPTSTLLETQASTDSKDPNVSAFMASLTLNERIAHKIAVEKLGTSYDITRTHGFVRWSNRT